MRYPSRQTYMSAARNCQSYITEHKKQRLWQRENVQFSKVSYYWNIGLLVFSCMYTGFITTRWYCMSKAFLCNQIRDLDISFTISQPTPTISVPFTSCRAVLRISPKAWETTRFQILWITWSYLMRLGYIGTVSILVPITSTRTMFLNCTARKPSLVFVTYKIIIRSHLLTATSIGIDQKIILGCSSWNAAKWEAQPSWFEKYQEFVVHQIKLGADIHPCNNARISASHIINKSGDRITQPAWHG